jgi:hypothetical protein
VVLDVVEARLLAGEGDPGSGVGAERDAKKRSGVVHDDVERSLAPHSVFAEPVAVGGLLDPGEVLAR